MSTANSGTPNTEDLEREIGRTREQLGDAVQQLAAKTDVKQQLARQAGQLRGTVTRTAKQAAGRARDDASRPVIAAIAAGVFAAIACVLLVRWRAGRQAAG
jgi:type VI protein secretion system component VasF